MRLKPRTICGMNILPSSTHVTTKSGEVTRKSATVMSSSILTGHKTTALSLKRDDSIIFGVFARFIRFFDSLTKLLHDEISSGLERYIGVTFFLSSAKIATD